MRGINLIMRHVARFVPTLHRDRAGTVLIEFAYAFPILLTMYLGSFTLSDAIACKRKVTIATRALTDLTTRNSALTSADMTTIMAASAQVMAPYPTSSAQIVVSQVKVTDSSHAQVIWSKTQSGTALTVGSSVNIPNGISATGTYLIVGAVSYSYTPPVAYGITGPINFADSIVMSPRLSGQITMN